MILRIMSGGVVAMGLYSTYLIATIAWQIIERPDHLNLQVGSLLLLADVGLSYVLLRPFARWTLGRD